MENFDRVNGTTKRVLYHLPVNYFLSLVLFEIQYNENKDKPERVVLRHLWSLMTGCNPHVCLITPNKSLSSSEILSFRRYASQT
jgi:hypothetical protein